MTDQIDPATFAHLVDLAALEMNKDEAEYLRRELNNQLKAIHELELIPLDADVPVASHGVPYTSDIRSELRTDEWKPYEKPGEIISQAPQVDEGYIVVPDIPHTDLE